MHFHILKNFVAVYSSDMSQQENQLMQIQQEINNVSIVSPFFTRGGGGGRIRGVALLIFLHFLKCPMKMK